MKVVAAYLLALLGGNAPTEDSIKTILGSVGADIDEDRLSLFLSQVDGKDINELIQFGREKFAVGGGGGGGAIAVSAPSAGAGAGAAAAAPAAEAAKEEKAEEKEESDDDMGFSLFD